MTAKPAKFHGMSLEALRSIEDGPRRKLGFQIQRLQSGLEPDDWRPMPSVGPGVAEIRVRDAGGAFRAIYVARLADAIHVLHVFEKKSRKTTPTDLRIARDRFRALVREKAT
jgi:phage-related protein